ncbi:MAG: hydrogenase [Spirochaetales bacterium]|nr:hydrogenase [Spirochaetales bacterium]
MTLLAPLLHGLTLLLVPPLLLGTVNKTKSWFAGRQGPPLLQPYYDLVKLFRKQTVLSTTTSWIFRLAPFVLLVSTAFAGLFVPLFNFAAPLSFSGDFILVAYLFALGRFFTTLAALDTGSAFEGMGASRELTFSFLTEPALFLGFLTLVKISGSLETSGFLLSPLLHYNSQLTAPLILTALGLFLVFLTETSRLPVDDPATHLELTMIHEAMILDHSGPLLGAVEYSSAMKFLILGSLVVHTAAPFPADWPGGFALPLAEVLVLAVFVGVLESAFARLRLKRVPLFLTGAVLSCGAGFLLMMR